MTKQKPKETPQAYLKRLQRHWYDRLANAGFKDAEDSQGRLRNWDSFNFVQKRYLGGRFELQEHYYELARELLNVQKFDSTKDKAVWAMHSEGYTIYEIAAKLRIGKSTAANIINKYKPLLLKEA